MAGSMHETTLVLKSKSEDLTRELQKIGDQTEALSKRQDTLKQKYLELAPAVETAKRAVKEATAELNKADNETNQTNFQNAVMQYKSLTDKMQEFKKAASSTGKEIEALNQQAKDLLNNTGSTTTQKETNTLSGALTGKNAAISAIGKQLSSAIGGAANAFLSSVLGSEGSTMVSSVLESAMSGAAAGALAGPVGALVGGLVGAAAGGISGATQIQQNKDEAYKSYVSDQYSSIGDITDSTLISGSDVAAGREQTKLSFSTLMGDSEVASRHLGALQQLAVATPYEYDDLTGISKNLLSYGYDTLGSYRTVKTITDAASALNWSTSDMGTIGTVLGRMTSTDKASLEYLNQMSDRALPVFQWLADAYDVSQKDVMTMISKGEISGTEAAQILTSAMSQAYDGAAEEQSKTYAGLSSTLSGVTAEIENAMGEGYNAARKEGISAQIDYMTDNSALEKLNYIIGEGRAYTENLGEQYTRDAVNAMLGGAMPENWSEEGTKQLQSLQEQYEDALARYNTSDDEARALAAADAEATYEAVQALAETEYEASGYAQELSDTAEKQYQTLQDINANIIAGWSKTYNMNVTMSKGMASNVQLTQYEFGSDAHQEAMLTSGNLGGLNRYIQGRNTHATGLHRVPYDNYPALLHEGERVLTAQEARNYGHAAALVTGNTFVVRQESDIDAIAAAIAERLERAAFVGE